MESIYYVMAWACHRRCKHCYEQRFRPYVRGALDAVVEEARRNFPRIIDHFPERMRYLDLADPLHGWQLGLYLPVQIGDDLWARGVGRSSGGFS